MNLKNHITVSLIFSAFLFAISKSWTIITSSLIRGVLIDIDHILDYSREHGIDLRIKQFYERFDRKEVTRVWLILHSWELLFLMSICAFLMSWNPWVVGMIIGLTQHIVLDQISNKINKWAYFFFWRLRNDFSIKKICPDWLVMYSC